MQDSKQDTKQVIDWALCLQLASNNPDVANELLCMFVNELSDTSAELHNLLESKDWEALTNSVHKLHGGACYTGVPQLKEAAKKLELTLNQDINEEKITSYYNHLQEQIDLVSKKFTLGNYQQ